MLYAFFQVQTVRPVLAMIEVHPDLYAAIRQEPSNIAVLVAAIKESFPRNTGIEFQLFLQNGKPFTDVQILSALEVN